MTNQLCEELHSYGIIAFIIISVIVAKYRRRRYPLILYVSNTLLYGIFYIKKCGHIESEHGRYRSDAEEYRDHNDMKFDFQRDKDRLRNSAEYVFNIKNRENRENNMNNNKQILTYLDDDDDDDRDNRGDNINDSSRPYMSFKSYDELQDYLNIKLEEERAENKKLIEKVKLAEKQKVEEVLNKKIESYEQELQEKDRKLREKTSQQTNDVNVRQATQAKSKNDPTSDPVNPTNKYFDDDKLANQHTPRSYLKLHNEIIKNNFQENKQLLSQQVPHWLKVRNNLEFKDLEVNIKPGMDVKNRVLKDKKLMSNLEKYEVEELKTGKYKEIWFTGKPGIQKIKYNGSATNKGFDVEDDEEGGRGGSYRLVDGDHINFRYEILKYISAGVYGQVLLVNDHAQDINMALKVMNNHTSLKSRLGLEYYAVRYIHRHILPEEKPFVVGAHGVDSFRNHQIFVYELLGESIWARHHRQKVRGDLLKKISWDLLEGLAVLDRIELVHNDLKPDNILFTGEEYPYVKIIDYWGYSQRSGPDLRGYPRILESREVPTGRKNPFPLWPRLLPKPQTLKIRRGKIRNALPEILRHDKILPSTRSNVRIKLHHQSRHVVFRLHSR